MPIFACVLQQGINSEYHPFHVNRLRSQVSQWYERPHRFVCLTDAPHWEKPMDIERIPLETDLKGWWSKLELFRPGLFDERVVYIDLDVEIVGPLAPFFGLEGDFHMIKDYNNPKKFNSSVMVFDPEAGAAAYTEDPPVTDYHGDQGWITDAVAGVTRIPKGWCPSFKRTVETFGPPHTAKIIVYHGQPKPWSTDPKTLEEDIRYYSKERRPALLAAAGHTHDVGAKK